MSPALNSASLLIGLLGSLATVIGTIIVAVGQYGSHKGRASSKRKVRQWRITRLIVGAILIVIFSLIGIFDTSTLPHPLPPSLTPPSPTEVPGVLLYRFSSSNIGASSLAWSPDSTHIASVDEFNGTIHVWDALTGQHTLTYQPPSTVVNSLSWSPDGKYIAANVADHLYILKVDQNLLRPIFVLDTPLLSAGNNGVAWSPDGTHIAIACSDNAIRVWNTTMGMVSMGQKSLTYTHHSKAVFALAWSPNGQSIASASLDQTIQIWNINDGNQVYRNINFKFLSKSDLANINTNYLYSNIAWSSNGNQIATENEEGIVSVWLYKSGIHLFDFNTNVRSFYGSPVAWSPDSRYIATISIEKGSRVIQIVDGDSNLPEEGSALFTLGHTLYLAHTLAWSPNEDYIAVASFEGVTVWKGRETYGLQPQGQSQDFNAAFVLIEFTGVYFGTVIIGMTLFQFLPRDNPYPPPPSKRKKREILLPALRGVVGLVLALLMITVLYIYILAKYIPFTPTTVGLSVGCSALVSIFLVSKTHVLISSPLKKARIYMKIRRYFKIGWTYVSKGDYHQAIECYDRLIALYPDNDLFYNNRGYIHSRLKEYKSAIEDYNRAIELNPNYALSYYNRANAYLYQRESRLAIEDYNQAIALTPNYSTPYLGRGTAYLWLKNLSLAKIDYLRSSELDLKNIRAKWMLAWIGMNKQRPDNKTAEHLEKLAKLCPKHYVAYICRGVALGIRGKVKEGLKEVERAIQLEPEEWTAYFWKAMLSAYYYQGQASDGRTAALIEQSLKLGLPPILLTPLYWLEKDRPEIFESCAKPLLLRL